MNESPGSFNEGKKIVISGTYGTGKSTTVDRLSQLTRIPKSVAGGMRELLPIEFPGKQLEECSPDELIQLGMVRYGERVKLESQLPNGFVSDGSALHEWAYGHGRQIEGTQGKGSEIFDDKYEYAMKAFGDMVKRYAKRGYTDIIHLPVEFPIPEDGHRPVSENFRHKADKILMNTWEELGFTYHTVKGSLDERIDQIVDILGLSVSTTLNGPKEQKDKSLFYENSEDALGAAAERYFSNGFKNTQHKIYDIHINSKECKIDATIDLSYPADWSKKNGENQNPHLTSIDSILISGQLAQMLMFSQDNITRENSNNLWVRELKIRPGKKPIDSVKGLKVSMVAQESKIIKMRGTPWRIANGYIDIGEGGFIVEAKLAYQLPS